MLFLFFITFIVVLKVKIQGNQSTTLEWFLQLILHYLNTITAKQNYYQGETQIQASIQKYCKYDIDSCKSSPASMILTCVTQSYEKKYEILSCIYLIFRICLVVAFALVVAQAADLAAFYSFVHS
jgi:hypothetical protein